MGSLPLYGGWNPRLVTSGSKMPNQKKGRFFYLRLGLSYLQLVFVAYGKMAWSLFLTVDIRLGLFAYGAKSVWSFYLVVPPCPKI